MTPLKIMLAIGLFGLSVLVGTTHAADTPSDADLQFFEAKIRPLLVERCYKCHSTQEGKDKGGLLLDSRSALLKGGDNGPAIVPGEPEKSRLIVAVGYKDVDLQMPPKGKLTDGQIADLSAWVKRGAPWPAEKVAAGNAAGPAAFDIAKRKAEHWAWQPIKAVTPPAVKNAAWPKADIDRFILAKLEEKGLTPSTQADKRTLIRRANFAIIGLPPTPEQVDAFLADESPEAFSRVVDRLLASPQFGERWARHWLDLVRFAESRGHEFDYDVPNAWQYRDYVIRAFNADVPYDQFVKEHVAGDLLKSPRIDPKTQVNESILATGFWFMGEWVHSPVDIRQDETDRVDNMIDVFGKTFQALTLGCARCHDHKFDAISAKDYYSIAGFIHSSSFREAHFTNEKANQQVAKNLRDLDAETLEKLLPIVSDLQQPVTDRLAQYLLAAAAQIAPKGAKPAEAATVRDLDPVLVAGWAEELKAARKDTGHPLHLFSLVAALEQPSEEKIKEVLRVAAEKPEAWTGANSRLIADYARRDAQLWVPRENRREVQPWIVDGDAFGTEPLAWGSAVVGSSPDRPIAEFFGTGAAAAGTSGPLLGLLRTPTFVIDKPWVSFRVSGVGQAFIVIDSHRTIQGPLHGVSKQRIKVDSGWKTQSASLKGYIGQRAHIEFTPGDADRRLAVEWVRLSDEAPPADAVPFGKVGARDMAARLTDAKSLAGLAEKFQSVFATTQQRIASKSLGLCESTPFTALVANWSVTHLDRFGYSKETREKVARLLADRDARRKELLSKYRPGPTAMAMLDGTPFDEKVLIRGSHKTPGELAPRRFLEAIDGPAPIQSAGGSGRLELADRLVDPANPFTSRVMVNRVWHHLFGRGIVASTDNFGVLGDRPTHPELLDSLAADFMKDGWSVKKLIRKVMLTQTWQMSSHETAAVKVQPLAAEIDPQNLLLHRANLRRLEGEAIRDEILFISGRMDETMFGPSVPVFLTAFMDGRGRPGQSGPMDGAGRRSVYLQVKRNFLSPMLLAFDMPSPFNSMGKRTVSNVPAQALILMNDPLVVQQAGLWAKRLSPARTPAQRIDQMYRQAFARSPTEAELAAAVGFLQSQGEALGIAEGKRQDDPRVWADLAHVLMNVKEFVYVP